VANCCLSSCWLGK